MYFLSLAWWPERHCRVGAEGKLKAAKRSCLRFPERHHASHRPPPTFTCSTKPTDFGRRHVCTSDSCKCAVFIASSYFWLESYSKPPQQKNHCFMKLVHKIPMIFKLWFPYRKPSTEKKNIFFQTLPESLKTADSDRRSSVRPTSATLLLIVNGAIRFVNFFVILNHIHRCFTCDTLQNKHCQRHTQRTQRIDSLTWVISPAK